MTIKEAELTEKEAARQFEIEASTMDRQQLYDLARRLWVDNAQWLRRIQKCTRMKKELGQEVAALKKDLSDAAMEIDCAGPVAHRIRKLKLELSTEITLLRCELAEVEDENERLEIELRQYGTRIDVLEKSQKRWQDYSKQQTEENAQLRRELAEARDTLEEIHIRAALAECLNCEPVFSGIRVLAAKKD